MNVAVLGATGGSGRWAVRLAIERGHRVRAVVRPGATHPGGESLEIREADVTLRSALERVLEGQDAVLSCLGLRRRSRWNPWSELLSPPDLTTRAAHATVAAMRARGVRRIVAISAAGVGESRRRCTRPVRLMTTLGNLGVAYRDLEGMESALRSSGLDWRIVRPVTLRDGAPVDRARRVDRYGLTSTVRRGDVALWMSRLAERERPPDERAAMIGGASGGSTPDRASPEKERACRSGFDEP